jgi:mono/diheme cytochrome c family protein
LAAVLVLLGGLAACASPPESLGVDLDAGRETFGRLCAACHGGSGQGGSAPALTAVLDTFPACDMQMQWITLGSEGWKDQVGPTYGAPGKEITAVMPSFGSVLTEVEIRQVAAFERSFIAEGAADAVLADCGL